MGHALVLPAVGVAVTVVAWLSNSEAPSHVRRISDSFKVGWDGITYTRTTSPKRSSMYDNGYAAGQKEPEARRQKAVDAVRRDSIQEGRRAEQERQLREAQRREHQRVYYPKPDWLTIHGRVNVGVTGNSGIGKSTLINTLRGLGPTDPGAAATGVTETTSEPKEYPMKAFGGLLHVGFWDLPGAGTQKVPRDTYIQDMGLRFFDLVLVMSANRVTETELQILQNLSHHGIPHLIVRNKVDQDVENEEEKGVSEQQTLDTIRQDLCRQIKDTSSRKPFLVSAKPKKFHMFDMPSLCANIVKQVLRGREVPESLQRGVEMLWASYGYDFSKME